MNIPLREPYEAPFARLIGLPDAPDLLVVFSAEADFDDFEVGEDL